MPVRPETPGSDVERKVATAQLIGIEGFDDVLVLRTGIDFYLGLLRRGEPFAYVKRTHGFWDRLADLPEVVPTLEPLFNDASARWGTPYRGAPDDPRTALSQLIASDGLPSDVIDLLEARRPVQGIWQTGAMADLIRALQAPHRSPRYFESIAFRGYPNSDHHPAHHDVRLLRRAWRAFDVSGRLPHDALVFKQAAIDGSLRDLWTALEDRTVVVVGPEFLGTLPQLLGLPGLLHAPIDGSRAYFSRHQILAGLRAALEELPRDRPIVLLFQAASLSHWLIHELFGDRPDVTMIDVGRAFDPYYPEVVSSQLWFRVNRDRVITNLGIEHLYR